MTLAETLPGRLADWKSSGEGRHTRTDHFPELGWDVTLVADRAESIGCLLWEATLTRTAAKQPTTLKAWAERIAGTSTGLLEPLALHEVDESRDEALLRSQSPTKRNGGLHYYEVHLYGTERALIRRFVGNRELGGKRSQIAFSLTHDALAKLLDEIIA